MRCVRTLLLVPVFAACTTSERATDTPRVASADSADHQHSPATPSSPPGGVDSVKIFYVATEGTKAAQAATASEKIGCGDVPITVTIAAGGTRAPLRFALERLLASHAVRPARPDLYNALSDTDLRIDSIGIASDRPDSAVIGLSGKFSYGGVCDAPRIEAQLMKTATQFPTIRHASFFINGRPLREMLSEK